MKNGFKGKREELFVAKINKYKNRKKKRENLDTCLTNKHVLGLFF